MLRTRRLCLRYFQWEDWPVVHAWSTDPETIHHVPGELPTAEETRAAVQSWMNGQRDSPPHYDFAVTLVAGEPLIGWCCIQLSAEDERLGELMYVFRRNAWGQGYATEAARALLDFGFSQLKLHRIHATCRPENRASWRVLEKLGMHNEGRLRQNTWIRGKWCDSYLYAILESDWGSA